MKMPLDMFEALKTDFYKVAHAVFAAKGPRALSMPAAWTILSRVEQERQYTGDLRAQLEALTGVPCSVDAIPNYHMGPWYNIGLADSHVATALKRILTS